MSFDLTSQIAWALTYGLWAGTFYGLFRKAVGLRR